MFYRIPTQNGVVPALQALFAFLKQNPGKTIYFNCTLSAGLLAVARTVPDLQATDFDYERVASVAEILDFLPGNYAWVVIEHIDAIVQEPSELSYHELNRDISALMNLRCNVLFLDDWAYLDQYWLRSEVLDVQV